MHDMPRVTIVFGKVVDLNQGNEDIYIIVLYIQRSYLHCTKLHCKFTVILVFIYWLYDKIFKQSSSHENNHGPLMIAHQTGVCLLIVNEQQTNERDQ